jgi:hypothetical protein
MTNDDRQKALYPWFEEHGVSLVHPDDLEALRRLRPDGKVFDLVGHEGSYTVIGYKDLQYRVRPDILRVISNYPDARLSFGKTVNIIEANSPAVIVDIFWHYKYDRPFFILSVDGKLKSRRYFDNELSAA